MTKRNVTHLFAAVALATTAPIAAASPAKPTPFAESAKPRTLPSGAPACGNVQGKVSRARCTATAPVPAPAKPVAARSPQRDVRSPAVLQRLLAIFGGGAAVRPRELRNGAPANGNVARRTSGGTRPVERPTTPTNNSN